MAHACSFLDHNLMSGQNLPKIWVDKFRLQKFNFGYTICSLKTSFIHTFICMHPLPRHCANKLHAFTVSKACRSHVIRSCSDGRMGTGSFKGPRGVKILCPPMSGGGAKIIFVQDLYAKGRYSEYGSITPLAYAHVGCHPPPPGLQGWVGGTRRHCSQPW